MGIFAKSVLFGNANRIRGPLRRDFNTDAWEKAWKHLREDKVDDRLYRSGIWISERWSALHSYRAHIENIIEPMNPRFLLLKWINEQTSKFLSTVRSNVEGMAIRSSVEYGAEITTGLMGRSRDSETIPGDAVLTLLGDVVAKIVDSYPQAESREDHGVFVQHYVSKLGHIFIQLTQLEHRWEECVQLGYWIEEDEISIKIFDPNLDYARSAALAGDRMSTREMTMVSEFLYVWDHARYALGRLISTVDEVQRKEGRLICSLTTERSEPLEATVLRYVVEHEMPDFMKDIGLPNFGHNKLRDLLSAYEVLASLGNAFREGKFTIHDSEVDVNEVVVPRVKSDDLVRLLRKALGWEQEKAKVVLSAFTYKKGSRDGGWSRPLLPVGGESIDVCQPLMLSHPARLVEHWMVRSGVSQGRKGRSYENELRHLLQSVVEKNSVLRDAVYVCLHDVDVKTEDGDRDIDILVRIENTILIGELKALSRPVMPWERRTYQEEILSNAPKQLALRMSAIRNSTVVKTVLANKTKYKGSVEDLNFVCAVISTHPEGSGCSVQNIPVIDWVSLEEYFTSNTYDMVWSREQGQDSKRIFTNPKVSLNLYSNSVQCAKRLDLYLKTSPRSTSRASLLSARPIVGTDPAPGSSKPLEYEQWFIRPYNLPEALASARSMVEAWENACQQQDI